VKSSHVKEFGILPSPAMILDVGTCINVDKFVSSLSTLVISSMEDLDHFWIAKSCGPIALADIASNKSMSTQKFNV
jgi:hypothetical protein